jgi:AraC family transcriptional regulator of adaptative response/methylated-DNA-[protein]-cysteine methyltransferase
MRTLNRGRRKVIETSGFGIVLSRLNQATPGSEREIRPVSSQAILADMITAEPASVGGQIKYAAYGSGAGELVVKSASYGANGRGARVAFTIVDSRFGRILIASTKTGLCWVGICDCDSRLESELRGDLTAAEIARNDGGMVALARMVVDYVSGRGGEITLPVDIRATPFQFAVWRELCAIPWGATRSYGEIARRLGRPDASRAVGHANGSNPLAIIIPCHRAIGADGSLTGYRWGLEYKRRMLDHESALVQTSLAFG